MTHTEKQQRAADFEETLSYWRMVGFSEFVRAANQKGYDLSQQYTADNLREFERYVREQGVSHTADSDEKLQEFVACYFYLGQWFKMNYGGEWHLSLEDEQGANFNRPVVINYRNATPGMEFNPRQRLTAFLLGRLKQGMKHNLDLTAGVIAKESAVQGLPLED